MKNETAIKSFLSFDVEALPGRAERDHVDRLMWGKVDGGEYGIARLCDVLAEHNLKGNFMVELAASSLFGDDAVRRVIDYLLDRGQEVHAHLHSELLLRQWKIRGGMASPIGMDGLDEKLSATFMDFAAWKLRVFTGQRPLVFRSGAFLFNENTVAAAKRAGFAALSNINSSRHGAVCMPAPGYHFMDEVFQWENGLIEIPVDFSPEPLTFDWNKYVGWYDRAAQRKKDKTFNLVMHSWSLLERRDGQMAGYLRQHEARLHQICEHLVEHTQVMGYREYLEKKVTPPVVKFEFHNSPTVRVDETYRACIICGTSSTNEAAGDACSGCGARTRHRQLAGVLQKRGNPFHGKRVLAAWASSLEKKAFLDDASRVCTFDARPIAGMDMQMDVQSMAQIKDGEFDCFLGLHVLNHVLDDVAALSEIHRVLTPDGLACITVSYRNNIATTAVAEVTKHFGKDALANYGLGTFRRYGREDVIGLFKQRFDVESELGFDELTGERMEIFFLRKTKNASVLQT